MGGRAGSADGGGGPASCGKQRGGRGGPGVRRRPGRLGRGERPVRGGTCVEV